MRVAAFKLGVLGSAQNAAWWRGFSRGIPRSRGGRSVLASGRGDALPART